MARCVRSSNRLRGLPRLAQEFAEALAKAIYSVPAVRDAGLPHAGEGGFTSGLAVMRSFADSAAPAVEAEAPSRLMPLAAAGCLANVLQHEARRCPSAVAVDPPARKPNGSVLIVPFVTSLLRQGLERLWTTGPAQVGYLLEIDAAERSRLLGLPSRLQDAVASIS